MKYLKILLLFTLLFSVIVIQNDNIVFGAIPPVDDCTVEVVLDYMCFGYMLCSDPAHCFVPTGCEEWLQAYCDD